MVWNCTQCGKCCKNWAIGIDSTEVETLKRCGYNVNDFLQVRHMQLFIKHKGSNCFFLSEDNLCRIQKEHGFDAKPDVCRRFPFDECNVNKFVCGNITKFPSKKPRVESYKMFGYKGKIIPPEALIYATSRIVPEDFAGAWYSILAHIERSKNKVILKSDMDGKIKIEKLPGFWKFKLKNWLACYSDYFLPGRLMLAVRSGKITVNFPCENMRLAFKDIKNVKIPISEKKKFLNFLKDGHGLIYKPDYPGHLLFCLFFVEDFAKQLACNSKKEQADAIDLINAFSTLNGIIRFPQA